MVNGSFRSSAMSSREDGQKSLHKNSTSSKHLRATLEFSQLTSANAIWHFNSHINLFTHSNLHYATWRHMNVDKCRQKPTWDEILKLPCIWLRLWIEYFLVDKKGFLIVRLLISLASSLPKTCGISCHVF